ncbi:hypothetical protein SLEP1_g51710 [Rubroshorea leprosula]|uniref:Uncharacterized protein n=1 Tax=Rubroshorea leprosula TaxID=152421 RepID=A0AAV5M482_9ROSI|nr:hypothetical protein SLEP1_g51710 [Rubroshorea leprosula]
MIIQQLHDQRVVLVNQDSFYHNLSEEELARVHEYNFDHPGEKHFYNLDTDFQGNWKHIFIFLLLAFALC